MIKAINNKAIIAVVITFIPIVFFSCKGKVIYTGSEEESQNYKFSQFIKQIHKFPYDAGAEKRKKVTEGFTKLTVGIEKEKVKELLGEPDAEFLSYDTTKGKRYVSSSWGYYLRRHEAVYANEQYDQTVSLYFDPDGKLYFVHPDNINTLKDKGGPHLRKR